jgi:hypothetical protein
MANSKMRRKFSDSGTGEHLRDTRAQFATYTVRVSQTERLEGEERHVDQLHPRMRVLLPGSEFVVTGDERGAGRSDALVEESQTVAGKSRMVVCEASHGDGEG